MKITIYSTTSCPYCRELKRFLSGKNIAFEEVIVDQDPKGLERMSALSEGHMGVPFTVIEKDGDVKKVAGFNKAKFEEILGI